MHRSGSRCRGVRGERREKGNRVSSSQRYAFILELQRIYTACTTLEGRAVHRVLHVRTHIPEDPRPPSDTLIVLANLIAHSTAVTLNMSSRVSGQSQFFRANPNYGCNGLCVL